MQHTLTTTAVPGGAAAATSSDTINADLVVAHSIPRPSAWVGWLAAIAPLLAAWILTLSASSDARNQRRDAAIEQWTMVERPHCHRHSTRALRATCYRNARRRLDLTPDEAPLGY